MLALLNPRVWIAIALVAALAFTHTMAWRKGSAHTQAAWNAAKVVQLQVLAEAEKASRAKEKSLQKTKDEAVNAAAEREKKLRIALAAARATGDGLRDDLAAARSDLSRASLSSVRAYAATLGTVFAECSAEVERLAGAAEGLAIERDTLIQAWPR